VPIITSTLTTPAAFSRSFWKGIMGEFMKHLPITLIISLSASLLWPWSSTRSCLGATAEDETPGCVEKDLLQSGCRGRPGRAGRPRVDRAGDLYLLVAVLVAFTSSLFDLSAWFQRSALMEGFTCGCCAYLRGNPRSLLAVLVWFFFHRLTACASDVFFRERAALHQCSPSCPSADIQASDEFMRGWRRGSTGAEARAFYVESLLTTVAACGETRRRGNTLQKGSPSPSWRPSTGAPEDSSLMKRPTPPCSTATRADPGVKNQMACPPASR
jgi:hypothetical protein